MDIDTGSVRNHLDRVTQEKRQQDAEKLLERRLMREVWEYAIAMMCV